jgi:ferric-dicitrate binding protein FerR (iron transport regulator)
MEAKYDSYRVEDFLDDAYFINWVKHRPSELEKFWNDWKASQPANLTAFSDAEKQLTLILSAERIEQEKGDKEELLQRIFRSIEDAEEKVSPLRTGIRRWMIAASVAALFIISGALWYVTWQKNTTTEFSTAYGEIKKIVLPDQSQITLNAHSHIAFKADWNKEDAREVWLDGEANFDVKHLYKTGSPIKESEKFIIHTSLLQVEVLGTVFNVKDRRGKVEVSLESGSVKVLVKAEKNKQWLLKPGEVAVYSNATAVLQKLSQDPVIHKAWTERKMLTNNTTILEIIQAIEDQYGYKVILEDPELANRRIDGTIPFKSESNVLFVLSNILDIDIEKKDSTLIFKSKK